MMTKTQTQSSYTEKMNKNNNNNIKKCVQREKARQRGYEGKKTGSWKPVVVDKTMLIYGGQ